MSGHFSSGNRRTRFNDPTAARLYRAVRCQMRQMVGYPIGKIPKHEKERWHAVRDALRARLAEIEAQRQQQQQQPPAAEAPQ
jgi:hypothetical protein